MVGGYEKQIDSNTTSTSLSASASAVSADWDIAPPFDLGRMANLKLVDKRGKELVELKLQVLVEVRTSSGWWSKKEIMSLGFYF